MSCLLGHSHPEIVEVIKRQADTLIHISSCMIAQPVLGLAKSLTAALPQGLDLAFFLSTGSESNEAAIRLAKTYTGKFEIVGLGQSWHGMTAGAQGAQYQAGRQASGPFMPGQHLLPQPNAYHSIFRCSDGTYDWRAELDYGWHLIDEASCGSLAACLVECVQGDGGIHALPSGYLSALHQHCRNRGMLLIVDEAQTGLGRTGRMFGIEHESVVPDILTLSKPLGNGLPISAVVTSAEINDVCKRKGFLFFTTHGNDPLVAAVGEKVLEVVSRPHTMDNVRIRAQQLMNGLSCLKDRYACIGDVRGLGLMAGIEIVSSRQSKEADPKLAKTLSDRMLKEGLWCQLQSQRVFRIGPPLTSSEKEIEEGLNVLEKVFRSTPGTRFCSEMKGTTNGFERWSKDYTRDGNHSSSEGLCR